MSTDPEYLWEIFQQNITRSLDVLCPIKLLTVVDSKPRWLSNIIIQ